MATVNNKAMLYSSLAPVTQNKFAAGDSTVPIPRFVDSSTAIPVVTLRATTAISTPASPNPPPIQGRARPSAIAGGNVRFTDQIINDSANTALNVTVRSNLPPALTLLPDICDSPPPGSSSVCDSNGLTVVYPSLPPHSRTSLNFSAQVGPSMPRGTLVQVTTATASDLPVFDPNTADSTLTFTVETSACSPQVPASAQVPAVGGNLSFPVTSCPPWSASVDQLWLGLTSGSFYNAASATVMVHAQSNTGPARSAKLTIGDQIITIMQSAGPDMSDFAGNGYSGALLYDPASGQSYAALSNANGTYAYAPNLLTAHLDTLRQGDYNGDGKTDLILYNAQTALAYIGFGTGDGTFNFQSLFWSPAYNFVETGDIDADGRTDVALYNSTTGTLYTAISNGTGTFVYKYHLVSIGFTFIRLADFTGDRKADLFLYNSATGQAFLGVGDGAGNFTFNPLGLSKDYALIDIGDLNADGKADLLLYDPAKGNAATGISDGLGGFSFTPLIFSPGFTSVRLADYTGDGRADITVYNKNTAAAYFGTGNGTGTFAFQSLFWSPAYDSVLPQDVNGDGKMDVVLYNSATGTEYTGISNGNGTFVYTYQYWGIGRVLAH